MCLCTQGGRTKNYSHLTSPWRARARSNRYPQLSPYFIKSPASSFSKEHFHLSIYLCAHYRGEQKEERLDVFSHTNNSRAASLSLYSYYLQLRCYYFIFLLAAAARRVVLISTSPGARPTATRTRVSHFPQFQFSLSCCVHEFVSEWGVCINGQ